MQQQTSIQTLKDCLRVSEAAEILGVSTKTLRNWDRAGKVKALRHPVNGYRIYPRSQIEELFQQTVGGSTAGASTIDPM
jgi:excisionase family DNA binding protein